MRGVYVKKVYGNERKKLTIEDSTCILTRLIRAIIENMQISVKTSSTLTNLKYNHELKSIMVNNVEFTKN